MSTDRGPGRLASLLSRGSEIVLGLGKFYGWGAERIANLFSTKFEPLEQGERDAFHDLTDRMVTAGDVITNSPFDELPDIGEIPINEYLWGGQLEGRRMLYVAEFQLDSGEQWYQVRIPAPDELSEGEIAALVHEEALRRSQGSPNRFNVPEGEIPFIIGIRVAIAERAY